MFLLGLKPEPRASRARMSRAKTVRLRVVKFPAAGSVATQRGRRETVNIVHIRRRAGTTEWSAPWTPLRYPPQQEDPVKCRCLAPAPNAQLVKSGGGPGRITQHRSPRRKAYSKNFDLCASVPRNLNLCRKQEGIVKVWAPMLV